MRWAPSNIFLVRYAWSLTSIVPHTTSGAARHFPYTMLRNYTIIFLLLSFLSVRSLCTQLNVSIDDTLGDERTGNMISYTGQWSAGQNCSSCTADIDASQVFEHTWHDTTFRPGPSDGVIRSASVAFNGMCRLAFKPSKSSLNIIRRDRRLRRLHLNGFE